MEIQQLPRPVAVPLQWRNNGFIHLQQEPPSSAPAIPGRDLAYDDINDEAEEAGKNGTVGRAAKNEWMSEPPQPPMAANGSLEQVEVPPTAKRFLGTA